MINYDFFPQLIVIFLLGVVVIPILSSLVEMAIVNYKNRKEYGKLAKTVTTLFGWLIVSFILLNGIGFDRAVITRALSLTLGSVLLVFLLYGFGKDVIVGLMLMSDCDVQAGVKVEFKDGINLRGRIREIGLARTKVISEDGKLHVLPNRTFQTAVFSIMSTSSSNC